MERIALSIRFKPYGPSKIPKIIIPNNPDNLILENSLLKIKPSNKIIAIENAKYSI
jgi:hypothetical protein